MKAAKLARRLAFFAFFASAFFRWPPRTILHGSLRFLPSASPETSITSAARTLAPTSSPRRAGSFSSIRAFEASVPLIRKSVESLGFHFSDIKILLISHAHDDHCAGSEQIIRLTGAKYYVMDGDVPVVESGGRTDFQYGAQKAHHYPPAHVDRVLHDGSTVSLGGTVLTAHLTAGHTKGTTTWTFDETENGRRSARRHRRQPKRESRATDSSATEPIRKSPRTTSAALPSFTSSPATSFSVRTAPTSISSKNIRAGRPATKTPSSTPPDTRPISPIANRHS